MCYIEISATDLRNHRLQPLKILFVSNRWIHCKMFWFIYEQDFFFITM